MEMNVVGAVSRAGERHSVLFCEYTGSKAEEMLINVFLNGLEVVLNRDSIYCLAMRYESNDVSGVVGIYYHKNGTGCMIYDKPYEYLTDYIMENFSEELKNILTGEEGAKTHDSKAD